MGPRISRSSSAEGCADRSQCPIFLVNRDSESGDFGLCVRTSPRLSRDFSRESASVLGKQEAHCVLTNDETLCLVSNVI